MQVDNYRGSGYGLLASRASQVVMGQSVASASAWRLSTFTYPYGPYAWITGQHGNGALLLGNHTAEWSPTLSTVVDVITSQVYGYRTPGLRDIPISGPITGSRQGLPARTRKPTFEILEPASFINNGTASQGNPVYLPDGVKRPLRVKQRIHRRLRVGNAWRPGR